MQNILSGYYIVDVIFLFWIMPPTRYLVEWVIQKSKLTYCRHWIIQKVSSSIFKHSPGQTDTLPLTPTQIFPIFLDPSQITLWKPLKVFQKAAFSNDLFVQFGAMPETLLRIGMSKKYIVTNGSRFKPRTNIKIMRNKIVKISILFLSNFIIRKIR